MTWHITSALIQEWRFSISNVAALSCCLAEFLDEEEPDASAPFQVFEDMLENNVSSRYIYYNKEAYSKMILQL